jgi:hypothetical protein
MTDPETEPKALVETEPSSEPAEDPIERYRSAVQACFMVGTILAQHDLPALLGEIASAEALGPILDPTLWIQKHKAMEQDRKLIAAAMPLRELVLQLQKARTVPHGLR